MQGIVKEVIYKDSDSEALYSILIQYNSGTKATREEIAFPLDTNIKRVPVVGEVVNLVKGMSSDSSPNVAKPQYYFTTPISLQKNINHNALPKGFSKLSGGGASSDGYADASAGNPNASSTKPFKFDFGFEEGCWV